MTRLARKCCLENPTSNEIFFAFETTYTPYNQYLIGLLPRIDLVIQNKTTGLCSRGLEVKLTALPDNTTCELTEYHYGTELVIRPDTIVYLACSIVEKYANNREVLLSYFSEAIINLDDWTEAGNIIPLLSDMIALINSISEDLKDNQTPIIMQPVWKTLGKSPRLANNCLDVFIWSNMAFIRLFTAPLINNGVNVTKINRQTRTLVWVTKMLLEFAQTGQFHHEQIIDKLSYNTKNDKAFEVSGTITQLFMDSAELTKPRIHKDKIRNIILGGGQKLLSPERRFDAIIYNSPNLFV